MGRKERLPLWCGFRIVLLLGLVTAVSTYLFGAIITGVAFHTWNYDVRCQIPTPRDYSYVAPIDVVGPCMMSFGGGIFLIVFIEWFFIKPIPTYLII